MASVQKYFWFLESPFFKKVLVIVLWNEVASFWCFWILILNFITLNYFPHSVIQKHNTWLFLLSMSYIMASSALPILLVRKRLIPCSRIEAIIFMLFIHKFSVFIYANLRLSMEVHSGTSKYDRKEKNWFRGKKAHVGSSPLYPCCVKSENFLTLCENEKTLSR